MEDISIPLWTFVSQGMTLQGSNTASRKVVRKMLDFAAFHGIRTIIQTFKLNETGIQEAISLLKEGKIRYKGVLVAQY
jgi:D-arabinose 1-dehydrogenase-like Zn-dependent alcohol dehydrogenase